MKQCESLGFGLNRERKTVRVSYIDRNAELGSLWASLIEALHKFDSNRPMRRTTIRLTAEGLAAEYVSFQWSIEEQRGQFGVLSARNWTRFWTRFFKPTRFSIPDRGGTETWHPYTKNRRAGAQASLHMPTNHAARAGYPVA